MKYKYYHGHTKAMKILQEDPVLDGCKLQEERRLLRNEFVNGGMTADSYDSRRYKLLKPAQSKGREAPAVIKMELQHGDFVVMHGENLQKYYEVCEPLYSQQYEDLS